MNAFASLLLVAVAGGPADEWSTVPPRALLAAEQARNSRKAHIEWTSRRFNTGRTRHYTSRFANDDQLVTNRGDDEGVVFRDALGNPLSGHRGSVHHVLLTGGQRWTSDGDHGSAHVGPLDREHALSIDIRSLGLSPGHSMKQDLHSTVWRSGIDRYGTVRYRSTTEDGLQIVRARVQSGDDTREAVWWIDPARGWCPIKTQWLLNDVVYRESRTTVTQFGKVWFPESVAFFAWYYEDGREPYRIISVHTATFDDSLPDRLTPDDIGVEIGTTIASELPPVTPDAVGWDGKKLVPYRDLVRRIRNGELEYGGGFLRHSRALVIENEARRLALESDPARLERGRTDRFGLSSVEHTPGIWEEYVKRFVARYKLNEDQKQAAYRILRVCQEQGLHYLKRWQATFEALETREEALKKEITDDESKTGKLAGVFRERAALQRPLVRIFEDQLVPRLDRLLTRDQRKAGAAPNKHAQDDDK